MSAGLTRRESIRRAALLAAAGGLPFGCTAASEQLPAAWLPANPEPVKASGYGKHNGFAAIEEYSRIKTVVIDYSGAQQDAFVMRINR